MSATGSRRWLAAHALAMGFSLAHLMLDWGVGLIDGPVGAAVTAAQALSGYTVRRPLRALHLADAALEVGLELD